jgi:hypothetical protein
MVEGKRLLRKIHSPALLTLLATIPVIVLSFAALVTSNGSLVSAKVTAMAQNAPDASWSAPVDIATRPGYDNIPHLAASPLNGMAQVIWTHTDANQAEILNNHNTSLGSAFGLAQIIDSYAVQQIEVIGIAHDSTSTGHSHGLTWKYSGQSVCDYYKQFDTNGNMTINVAVPGSCSTTQLRKIGAIAVDSNLTVHILLGRDGTPGSMAYWQRNSAGVWTVQGEALPAGCAPGDLSLAVTTQGKVMAAWKDCGASGQGTDIVTGLRVSAGNWQVDDISASCCSACPNVSGAYLPHLAADPSGGIRAAWADGRCPGSQNTDIYYREWIPSTGWSGKPIVQVVSNGGNSYYPDITVDNTGEAHIVWGDDTNSPFAYYRIFYSHGHGTTFSAPTIPFNQWFPTSWQRDPSVDFADGAVHVAFASIRNDPNKDLYYSYIVTALPPPPCAGHQFTDVCPGTYYYTAVTNLVNANIISGYSTAPPCPNNLWIPCFLPNNTATRGQVSKIIKLGANIPTNTTGGPHFTDVPTTNIFYQYIETLYNAHIIGGYTTGCSTGNPCFKPNSNVTRGQLSKMASLAFGFNEAVSGQTFQDVPPSSIFYTYIQRLNGRGIINGYACGNPEPCVPPDNRPYFRPNNNITRGQLAKIIDLCRQQP